MTPLRGKTAARPVFVAGPLGAGSFVFFLHFLTKNKKMSPKIVPNGSQVEPKSELRTHFESFFLEADFWRRKGDLPPNFLEVILGPFWHVFVNKSILGGFLGAPAPCSFFGSVLERSGDRRHPQNIAKSLYCRTKTGVGQNQKKEVQGALLAPFWEPFWSCWAHFL